MGPGWGLDVGVVVAFTFLINLLLMPIAELSEILDQTQTALAGWRKVLGVPRPARRARADRRPGAARRGRSTCRARDVAFAYRDGVPVLRDVDVALPAGRSVAIVGETGSGKTTFAKLLCRMADPTAGEIRLGGLDLRRAPRVPATGRPPRAPGRLPVRRHDRRERADRPARRRGRTDGHATTDGSGGVTSDEGVRQAFLALGLGWWLDDLPLGLDTPVGERGGNLSVGERQLVALARAQLGDPGLLVLDEATSAVDAETERALAGALERLSTGRTMVSIAHRLSTAETADLVLVFDEGRIVERGTHAELVAAGGTYARLYESWLGNTHAVGWAEQTRTPAADAAHTATARAALTAPGSPTGRRRCPQPQPVGSAGRPDRPPMPARYRCRAVITWWTSSSVTSSDSSSARPRT